MDGDSDHKPLIYLFGDVVERSRSGKEEGCRENNISKVDKSCLIFYQVRWPLIYKKRQEKVGEMKETVSLVTELVRYVTEEDMTQTSGHCISGPFR